MGKITADKSVQIDKELEKIKKTVDDYSNYFYCEDQEKRLMEMKEIIDDIFSDIGFPEH